MTARLDQQIAFLNEADKLKSIDRATVLADRSRAENSANIRGTLHFMRLCSRIRQN